jgi:hypothetical protein
MQLTVKESQSSKSVGVEHGRSEEGGGGEERGSNEEEVGASGTALAKAQKEMILGAAAKMRNGRMFKR